MLYVRTWYHTVVACDDNSVFTTTHKNQHFLFFWYVSTTAASAASMYTAVYMCGVITCHGSTAQQQSAFTLEAGPTRETTALC